MDSHWVSHGVARSTQTTKLRVRIHARTQRPRTSLTTRLPRDGHACELHACVRRAVVRSSWRSVSRSSPKTEPTSRSRDTSQFRGLVEIHASITFLFFFLFLLLFFLFLLFFFFLLCSGHRLPATALFAPRIADKINRHVSWRNYRKYRRK